MLRLYCCIIEAGRQLKRLIRVSGLVAGVGLVISLAPSAYAQDLVINGTFDRSLYGWNNLSIPEIGAFAWDRFGYPGYYPGHPFYPDYPGSARGDRVLGPGSALYSRVLAQNLLTVAGDDYSISFQFYLPAPGPSNLRVSFGGHSTDVIAPLFPDFHGWYSYLWDVKANSSGTFLRFEYTDLYSSIYIDNVSVRAKTDVPSPLPLFGLGGGYVYSRRLRKRIQRSKPAQGLRRVG